MLTMDAKGAIVERRGDDYLDENTGVGAFSRLLRWRRRSHLKALRSNEKPSARSPAWQVAGAVTTAMRTPRKTERQERISRWSQPGHAAATERASMRQTLADAEVREQEEEVCPEVPATAPAAK